MNAKLVSIICISALFVGGLPFIMASGTSDATEPFTITDSTGNEIEYTEPAERLVTLGYAYTLTVTILGGMDRIIATDSFSTHEYTGDDRLAELNATNLGTSYTTDNTKKMLVQFIQWVDEGKMSLDDTIIMTKYSATAILYQDLKDNGFTKVLMYDEITDYDQIVELVEGLSKIVTGGVDSIVDDMRHVKEEIKERLEGVETDGKGIGLWYVASTGTFTIHNYGSLTVSLIESAGGTNIGYSDNGARRYGDINAAIQLIDENPGTVIFLPDNYLRENTMNDFRNAYLGSDESVVLVHVQQSWNNYCPDAMYGLWAFACAMYPDIFEGEAPTAESSSDSNFMLYLAAGLIVVVIIAVGGFFFMRKP